MYNHHAPALVRNGTYFPKEKDKIGAELLSAHPAVTLEGLAELLQGKTLLAARKARNHIPYYQGLLVFAHSLVALPGPLYLLRRIFIESLGPSEYEEVESHKGRLFEAQGPGAVRHSVLQVGPGPVDHRHEVVGDAMDTALGKVAYGLLVVFYVAQILPFRRLDMLVHRHALHPRPAKAVGSNLLLPLPYFLNWPYFPIGDMVQRGDYVRYARLPDIIQAHRIGRTVPAPAFSHSVHQAPTILFPSRVRIPCPSTS